jgi:cytochrome b561
MKWRNGAERYGIIAQSLHWLIAALVFAQIALGIYVDGLPVSLARLQWVARHKSLGLLILALFVLRLAWRGFDHAPALPGSVPRRQRHAAAFTHWLIYALAILAPLAGWLHASAAGLGASFFGLFPVPSLMAKNADLSDLFAATHAWLVWLLAVLLLLHVAAALRHLMLGDRVFERMSPHLSGNPPEGPSP